MKLIKDLQKDIIALHQLRIVFTKFIFFSFSFFLVFFFFFEIGSHYVADCEFSIFSPPLPMCWDYRCVPLHPVKFIFLKIEILSWILIISESMWFSSNWFLVVLKKLDSILKLKNILQQELATLIPKMD
jgi:hypothetical protein